MMLEPYVDPFEYEEETVDVNSLRDFLEGVLYEMYQGGDVYMMESHLDEMAHVLGMKVPEGEPIMEKKND